MREFNHTLNIKLLAKNYSGNTLRTEPRIIRDAENDCSKKIQSNTFL